MKNFTKYIIVGAVTLCLCLAGILIARHVSTNSISCPDLPTNIPNGNVVVNYKPSSNKYVVGTNITFKCKSGYELPQGNEIEEYICGENGTWNSPHLDPRCLTVKYEFKITPTKETFDNARILCKSIQGDLITTNLKHEGDKYHDAISNTLRFAGPRGRIWVGVTDRGGPQESWRYVTDNSTFVIDETQYSWVGRNHERHSNGSQHCVTMHPAPAGRKGILGKQDCSTMQRGLCEIKYRQ